MIYAKPSTALLVVFRAYLSSDHVTPATGKTIAITISKNGGAFGNPNAGATNATEISSGFYKVSLDATDTGTAGPLAVRGAEAACDDVGAIYQVGQAPSDVTHLLGTAWLTPGTAGTPDVNVKLWNALTTVALPLVPTTAGRTLDVSTGGEAGVDWANVGSPTTVVGLSGTTVKTATDVETDTADIQTRLPAALVSGRIDASVGAMAANTMTAAAAAADLSAEIADAVWDEDATGHQTGGTFGQAIGDPGADTTTIYQSVVTDAAGTNVAADIIAIKAVDDAILVDTGTTLDGRIPAALVGGRMDSSVGAMAANTLTAAATAADFSTEVNAAVLAILGTPAGASLAADIATVAAFIDTEVAAILAKTNLIPGTQDGKTFAQTVNLISAVLLGKVSGVDTGSPVFRDMADAANRVSATVDAGNNRTGVTLNPA